MVESHVFSLKLELTPFGSCLPCISPPLLSWGLRQRHWDSTGMGLGSLEGAPAPRKMMVARERCQPCACSCWHCSAKPTGESREGWSPAELSRTLGRQGWLRAVKDRHNLSSWRAELENYILNAPQMSG